MKTEVFIFARECDDPNGKSDELKAEGIRLYSEHIGKSLTLYKLPNGKPVFREEGYFLSVSHTKGLFVMAFSRLPVGIDCEERREVTEKVRERYFSDKEKDLDFFKVWCGKEAVSKLSGGGLSVIKDCVVGENFVLFSGKKYFLYEIRQFPKCQVSVACEEDFDISFSDREFLWNRKDL